MRAEGSEPTTDVVIRPYKQIELGGGTLLVSVPHLGVGSLLLTDFILEQLSMDQVACMESDAFPPIAMLRKGKPRAPVRIHADPSSKVAVLRCEFNPPPHLAAPMAKAIVAWATSQKLKRIIAFDGLIAPGDPADAPRLPDILFATTSEEARAVAKRCGIPEFADGILGGVLAVLLLESKFHQDIGVQALLAVFENAIQDARSSLGFANALHRLLPELRFNASELEAQVKELDAEVRALQAAAEKAVARLFKKTDDSASMYG